MGTSRGLIVGACLFVVVAFMVSGSAAADDELEVTCTTASTSPLWTDAHKAVNFIRNQSENSDKCCQKYQKRECTVLYQWLSARVSMCTPNEASLCSKCKYVGDALFKILRQCVQRVDDAIKVSGYAAYPEWTVRIDTVKPKSEKFVAEDGEYIEMITA